MNQSTSSLATNAEQIRDLGQELYARMRVLSEHLARIRKGLNTAVDAYNDAVGSIERRVLPTARKFRELGAGSGDEVEVLERLETVPRPATAAELIVEIGPIQCRHPLLVNVEAQEEAD